MDWIGWDWMGMGWNELDWVGLDWNGWDWGRRYLTNVEHGQQVQSHTRNLLVHHLDDVVELGFVRVRIVAAVVVASAAEVVGADQERGELPVVVEVDGRVVRGLELLDDVVDHVGHILHAATRERRVQADQVVEERLMVVAFLLEIICTRGRSGVVSIRSETSPSVIQMMMMHTKRKNGTNGTVSRA